MDFRFRRYDGAPSTFFSSATTSSYFTEQALRAGYISGDIRGNGFVRNSVDVQESIQREIEKDRIREEILSAELERRRVLEAEVRRELQMERELAALRRAEGFFSVLSEPRVSFIHHLRGSRFEERLSFPGSREIGVMTPEGSRREDRLSCSGKQETGVVEPLPFQRHPEATEISKGKVVFLAKPVNTSLAGTKRKETAVATGTGELSITGAKKKPQEWSCALCQISATSEQVLEDHLRGKKHKAKEEQMKASKMTVKNTGSSTPLPKKTDKPTKLSALSEEPKQGKQQEGKQQHAKQNVVTLVQKKQKKESKKKTAEAPLSKKQKREDLKNKFKLWCDMCHVGANSERVMAAHKSGKKHMARLKLVKQNGGADPDATTMPDTTQGESENGELAAKITEEMENKWGLCCGPCGDF
uniref:U1-type domain-containing protein n=1 Tax=Nelumbo nucifera TaxID=4432 RepID=A0A822Y4L2_NELNU|nr:TPA_asm: hypothetical protein HUJ06_028938 [Nelumbo nucifera]